VCTHVTTKPFLFQHILIQPLTKDCSISAFQEINGDQLLGFMISHNSAISPSNKVWHGPFHACYSSSILGYKPFLPFFQARLLLLLPQTATDFSCLSLDLLVLLQLNFFFGIFGAGASYLIRDRAFFTGLNEISAALYFPMTKAYECQLHVANSNSYTPLIVVLIYSIASLCWNHTYDSITFHILPSGNTSTRDVVVYKPYPSGL
jgi:hypothetical protein